MTWTGVVVDDEAVDVVAGVLAVAVVGTVVVLGMVVLPLPVNRPKASSAVSLSSSTGSSNPSTTASSVWPIGTEERLILILSTGKALGGRPDTIYSNVPPSPYKSEAG